jgi:phosphatidylserine/phosphatidylglycerophosphate/cardiolipin synthase-like enzyme
MRDEPDKTGRVPAIELLTDRDLYQRVIQEMAPSARAFLWIATADIKDMHVHRGRRVVPFLAVLSELVDQGVSVRLLHAREPGPAFRRDYDRYPNLIDGLEMILCPRVHFKSVVVDGRIAYTGSANLTGAGLGAKSPRRRNFEMGLVTEDPALVATIAAQFDALWMGLQCRDCDRKQHCASYLDLLANHPPAQSP